jgi:ankyrin repeat protein
MTNEELLTDAINKKDLKIIKNLIKNGTNIHAQDDWALCYASLLGYLEIVKLLVENGASIHTCNDYPIRMASIKNHTEVVEYLESFK